MGKYINTHEGWIYYLMKEGILRFFTVLVILVVIITSAACVAPPKAGTTAGSKGSGSQSGSGSSVSETPTTPLYVTMVTPYGATPQKTAAPVPTTAPPEEWVHIYSIDQNFTFTQPIAMAYDLKNPPMVINYSLIPVNVTRNQTIFHHYGTNEETSEIIKYEIYDPLAYFEVTVRDKNTGSILVQDGFGNSNGKMYSAETNKTLKVLNQGDVLVELSGNWINANVTVQVKKAGNFDNSTNLTGLI